MHEGEVAPLPSSLNELSQAQQLEVEFFRFFQNFFGEDFGYLVRWRDIRILEGSSLLGQPDPQPTLFGLFV